MFDMAFKGNISLLNLVYVLLISLSVSGAAYGQGEKKFIREGNREYAKNNFAESEISYRRAVDKNNASADAVFNTGDALYKQKKYDDAAKQFVESSKMEDDIIKRANAFYNTGNSLLMTDRISESIEAYKNSLRLYPANAEAKYNLAYAQDLLKQQQQQQQQQEQQQQQDKQEDNEGQNEREEEQNNDQDKPGQNNEQEQEDRNKENEQQQGISREDAERLLDALTNDEKDIQEKVKLQKASRTRVNTLKNW